MAMVKRLQEFLDANGVKYEVTPHQVAYTSQEIAAASHISGKAIANLEIEKITHDRPTFIGDTIYSESTVLGTRESSQGDRGTVTVETRVLNQKGERVMTFRRTALVPKKSHATLGEGKLPA